MKNLLLIIIFVLNFEIFANGIPPEQSSTSDVEFAKQISEQQKLNLEEFHNIAKELEVITGKLPATGDGCKDCGSAIINNSIQENHWVQGSFLVVFVSFSMPKASLIELSDQAQKYNATLVLRGVYEDSFLKTKDKILEINPNGLHLDINPQLFKEYRIERVPTFVLLKNGKEINRLSGNVTLEFAHQKLLEEQ